MNCLHCNSSQFKEKNTRFSPEVKGTVVDVIMLCKVCQGCNTFSIDAAQLNILRRIAVDKYREMHNLLTSQEIIQFRENLNMTQSGFAQYLNVGESSIKRWETYFVQDHSQDDHIRLKCDEYSAEANYLRLHLKNLKSDIYNGKKCFSFELFKNISLFLMKEMTHDLTTLGKLHFYADFLHYKSFSKSITGSRYIVQKSGPIPYNHRLLYRSLETEAVLKRESEHNCKPNLQPNLQVFDDQEQQTLYHVIKMLKDKGERNLAELATQEQAFVQTEDMSFISYTHAKDLLI